MLEWINSLGGIDRWLFEIRQDVIIEYEAADQYESYFFDLLETDRSLQKREADFFHQWTLYAENLELQELQAITEIKGSPQVYAVQQSGERIGVVSVSLIDSYNREANLYDLITEIRFARNFDPERWLDPVTTSGVQAGVEPEAFDEGFSFGFS